MKVIHRKHTETAEVYTVTNAPRPMSEDIGNRQRRYLISMGIRTGCFIGAVLAAVAGAPLWAVLLLVVGAIFLPYISVVVANGGREPQAQPRFQDPDSPQHKGISGHRPEIGS
ncbi:DUF3099 domain-containing protein [Actinomadura sp. 9N407]|uniref:DUF3099 domain-containing protein n=1 Tax=Actinomadura sp. 9N407 TaxID=3375154 RepID=UPI0037A96CD9